MKLENEQRLLKLAEWIKENLKARNALDLENQLKIINFILDVVGDEKTAPEIKSNFPDFNLTGGMQQPKMIMQRAFIPQRQIQKKSVKSWFLSQDKYIRWGIFLVILWIAGAIWFNAVENPPEWWITQIFPRW